MQLFVGMALGDYKFQIKDFSIPVFSSYFELKQLTFYVKKYQNVIPNSLTHECTGEGIVEAAANEVDQDGDL